MPTSQAEQKVQPTPKHLPCRENCTPEGRSSRPPLVKPLLLYPSLGNPYAGQTDEQAGHHDSEQPEVREMSHIEDIKRLSTLSDASTIVERIAPESTSHCAFLESKFGLASNQVQFVLQNIHSHKFFRKDLSLFLSKNYFLWKNYGVWHQEHYQLTTPNSDTVSWINHLLNMDVKNENGTAVNELRKLIILHRLLIEFDCLKNTFENSEGKKLQHQLLIKSCDHKSMIENLSRSDSKEVGG